MTLDLTNIETDVEAVLDTVLASIPGNPGILLGVERPILHAVLIALVSLIDSKLKAAPVPVVTIAQVPATAPTPMIPGMTNT